MTQNALQRDDTALDFSVADHGSIVLLLPCTPAAEAWVEEHIPDDAMTFGKAYAVERRYFGDIYHAIKAEGLVIA
jgi:hypothetical protein